MKIDELSKFAFTLSIIPIIPAVLLYKHSMLEVAKTVILAFEFLALLCFLSKPFAKILKKTLQKIGNFLGKYVAIIILAIGYIVAVIPTGLLMKAVKRDRLRLKKPDVPSYWINSSDEKSDYEYQF